MKTLATNPLLFRFHFRGGPDDGLTIEPPDRYAGFLRLATASGQTGKRIWKVSEQNKLQRKLKPNEPSGAPAVYEVDSATVENGVRIVVLRFVALLERK